MKKIIYIILSMVLIFSACQDPFELTPNDIISDAVVFEDENLADAYLADLYARVQFYITDEYFNLNSNLIDAAGGESRNFATWQAPFGQIMDIDFNEELGAGVLDYWKYRLIRDVNVFIENLTESNNLSEEYVDVWIAEAKFIRAYAYFEMVKRFGGVPLITEVLSEDSPEDLLFPSRNSEKEIYDFIAQEMDEIETILPALADEGRIDKWTALALKSRAMLYAASVAQFGEQKLNGLLGFPSGEAGSYYQKSLEASKKIMDEGPFSLYNKHQDPVQNFINLFIDEDNNPEVIFAEKFDFDANKGHAWDILGQPAGFGSPWNSNYPTYLETIENFDFVDGTSGEVDRSIYDDSTPIDPDWYFGERDPRMRASIFYPGTSFKDGTVYFHRSTDYTDPDTGEKKRSSDVGFTVPGTDWPGAAHFRHIGSNGTGLLIRKRIDPSTPDGTLSSTDFIIFRLGEIMLNYVEAAYYLSDPNGDMVSILNKVRERAGMPDFSASEISEEKIRRERKAELAFEAHSFWDLRRWRIAVEELHNVMRHRMHFRYDYDTGMYTIAISDGDQNRRRRHPEENYYYALGIDRIADNPNLVENPGY